MNNVNLNILEQEKINFLKKYELDSESINQFKSKIKSVSKENSDELGSQLFTLIKAKHYGDVYEKAVELIYEGANVDFKEETKGDYPLLICTRKNYLKTFLVLLRAGANVNQVNNYLTTATMASARHGYSEMLKLLILMGADVNAKCLDGDTAIMSAKRHDMIECFKILLDANANLTAKNLSNQSVIDIPSNYSVDLTLFEDGMKYSNASVTYQDLNTLIEEAEQKLKKLVK